MLADAVRAAVAAIDTKATDTAAVELAIAYAAEIDEGGDLTKLGPALATALDALLLTPRARAAAVKGGSSDGGTGSVLDELRERRAGRQRDAETVDGAAT
ncbi:terminase small subunit [Haloactinopolyspora alba]|uniref:terminase small subunit n=1 Tax=Haloactinopolyspora alba TaxID=648780 RepID=UPI000D0CBDC1|nr:hypothetical protein [Haloactinopolyspora alba]